jgi:uncharacterized small protein (DUF1192 family)
MSTSYPEQLQRRIVRASKLPIDSRSNRQKKLEALQEAAQYPRAATPVTIPITAIFAQSLRPATAVRMFEDGSAADVPDVRDAAVDALEAITSVHPKVVAHPEALGRLLAVRSEAPAPIQRRLLTIIGEGVCHANPQFVEQQVIDEFETLLSPVGWSDEVSPEAIETIGTMLLSDAPKSGDLAKLLTQAVETSKTTAWSRVARAAGMGLAISETATEPLDRLLRDAAEKSDPRVLTGVAEGAYFAMMSEEESIESIGRTVLDDLSSAERPAVRKAVADGVAETVDRMSESVAAAQCDRLEAALRDDSAAVQTAAVEAATCGVADRDGEIEEFVELLETAVIELSGDPRAAAVKAIEGSDVRDAFTNAAEQERDRLTEAIEETLIDRPVTSANVFGILNGGGDDNDGTKPSDDAETGEDLSDHSIDELEERAADIAEEHVPDEAEGLYDDAESMNERVLALLTIAEWYKKTQPDELTSAAPWATVLRGWNSGEWRTRRAALTASVAAVDNGHVCWDTVVPIFGEAQNSTDPDLREAALEEVSELLQAGELEWEAVEGWVDRGVADPSTGVWKAAVDTVGSALEVGEIDWPKAREYIDTARNSSSHLVAGYSALAVAYGIRGDNVTWEQAEPILHDLRETQSKRQAKVVVLIVANLIDNEKITWEQAGEFILEARADDSAAVVEAAVKGIGYAVENDQVSWENVAEHVTSIRDQHPPKVIRQAFITVGRLLKYGKIDWEQARDYYEFARTADPQILESSLRVLKELIEQEDIEWEHIRGFIGAIVAEDPPEKATLAADVIDGGLSEQVLELEDVGAELESAMRRDDQVVAAGLNAVYNGIVSESLKYSEVAHLFADIHRLKSESSVEKALQIVGASLQEDDPDWDDVQRILATGFDYDDDGVIVEVIRAVRSGLLNQDLGWNEVSSYLDRGRRSESEQVAEAAVGTVKEGLFNDTLQWEEVAEYLRAAREHEHETVRKTAVEAVGAGLQEGTIEWNTARDYLQAARSAGKESVAREALRAVRAAVANDSITWSEARQFFEESRDSGSSLIPGVAAMSVSVLYQNEHLEWDDIEPFVADTIASAEEEAARAALRSITHGFIEHRLAWDQAEPHLTTAIDRRSEAIRTEAMSTLAPALGEELATWEEVQSVAVWPSTGESDEVVTKLIESVGKAAAHESVSWSEVGDFLAAAYEIDSEEVLEAATVALCTGVAHGAFSWTDCRQLFVRLRNAERPALTPHLLNISKVGVTDEIPWYDVEPLVRASINDERESVSQQAVQCAQQALCQGDATWADVGGHLTDALSDTPAGVATEAIQTIGYAFNSKAVTWPEIAEFVETGASVERGEVAEYAVDVVREGLSLGQISWGEVNKFLTRLRDNRPEPVARWTIEAASAALSSGKQDWSDIEPFLRSALESEHKDVRIGAINAAIQGIRTGTAEWEEIESFLLAAKEKDREEITLQSVEVMFELLFSRDLRWSQARSFVTAGFESDSEQVLKKTTETIGATLEEGTARWEELRPSLERAAESDHASVAAESVRAVAAALENDTIHWIHAETFVSDRRIDGNDRLALKCLSVFDYGVRNGFLQPREWQERVRRLITSDADVKREVAKRVLVYLTDGTLRLTDVTPLLQDLLQMDDARTRLRALRGVATSVDSNQSSNDTLLLLHHGLTDPKPGIRQIALEILESTIAMGAGFEAPVCYLLDTAVEDRDADAQSQGVELIEMAVTHDVCSPDRLRQLLFGVIHDESAGSEARATAVDILVDHRSDLDIGDELYGVLRELSTANNDPVVCRSAIQGLEQLVVDGETDPTVEWEPIVETLWDQLQEGSDPVREQSATALARIHRTVGVTLPEPEVDPLRFAITDFRFTGSVRLTLVDLLVSHDPTEVRQSGRPGGSA